MGMASERVFLRLRDGKATTESSSRKHNRIGTVVFDPPPLFSIFFQDPEFTMVMVMMMMMMMILCV